MELSEKNNLATSKFDSCDDLLKSVWEFYYSKEYGISVRGSRKDKHVILQCGRGDSYRNIRGISSKQKKLLHLVWSTVLSRLWEKSLTVDLWLIGYLT